MNKVNYNYTVTAVVFGSDESILDVTLRDNFYFRKMSLVPFKDHLDEIFKTDAMGLRLNYETAKINDDLDVICICKKDEGLVDDNEVSSLFERRADHDFTEIDNIIRAIRLFGEGPLRVKYIAMELNAPKINHKHIAVCPVNEAMSTIPISEFRISKHEINNLNQFISTIQFPFNDELLNTSHMLYDLSYHEYKFVSATLLTTALEIIFLEKDSGAKKEMLSKRVACYLYNDQTEILDCYNKMKTFYKKRSSFVHDGVLVEISSDDIIMLRDIVRRSIIKRLSDSRSKKAFVEYLKDIVCTYNGLIPEFKLQKQDIFNL